MKAYKIFLFMQGSVAMLLSAIFVASTVYQVVTAGLSPLQLVLVGTTLELAIFLFEVPTGVVADVYSRRLSIIIGYILMGCGFLLEGAIPWIWTILGAQVLWGVGYTFTSGATQAWITDEIGEEAANKAFVRAGQVETVTDLLGVGMGVALGLLGVNVPILAGGALLVVLALILALSMPETGFKPTPRGERNTWQHMGDTFRRGLGTVRGRPLLQSILLIGFFYGLYSEGFDRLWMKHLLDSVTLPAFLTNFGGQSPEIVLSGGIRVGSALLGLLAMEILHRRLDTGRIRHLAGVMMWATAAVIGGLLVLAWLNKSLWVMVPALWVIGVSRQVIGPLYTAWVNRRLDSQVRATVLSMSSQVDAIGQIAGGPVLGVIGSVVSVQAALSGSAALLAPVLALLGRGRAKDEEPETDIEQGQRDGRRGSSG